MGTINETNATKSKLVIDIDGVLIYLGQMIDDELQVSIETKEGEYIDRYIPRGIVEKIRDYLDSF